MSEQISKPLIEADPTKGVKVNAGVVAKSFRDEIKEKVGAMKQEGIGKLFRQDYDAHIFTEDSFEITKWYLFHAIFGSPIMFTHQRSCVPKIQNLLSL